MVADMAAGTAHLLAVARMVVLLDGIYLVANVRLMGHYKDPGARHQTIAVDMSHLISDMAEAGGNPYDQALSCRLVTHLGMGTVQMANSEARARRLVR